MNHDLTKAWVYQDPNYALGNFVNVTPVIRWIFARTGNPVPVYFGTEYVREMYHDHPYITEIKEAPSTEPIVSSALVCRENTMPDYMFAFEKATGEKWTPRYKPFAGFTSTFGQRKRMLVLLNGSGSENTRYVESKDPGPEVYRSIVERAKSQGYHIVFAGSGEDYRRNGWLNDVSECVDVEVGDIRKAMDLIYQADRVIGNDTGLVHAAGAIDKHLLVLWKHTPFTRCQNSGVNTTYVRAEDLLLDRTLSEFLA